MDRDDDRGGLASGLETMRASAAGFGREIAAAAAEMRAMDRETRALSRSLGSSLRSAFDKAVFGGRELGGVLRDLASDVVGKTLDAALRPVQGALSQGIGAAVGALAGGVGSVLGFAGGGVIAGGRAVPLSGPVRAFARGGVVDGPTLFPMRGATGLMGEAGPEAILPLSRGRDGRLGVQAEGSAAPVTVNVTISTPDIEGFRRSRGQVAAELARAVRRGSGRL